MKNICLIILMILPFMAAGQDTAQASLTVFSAEGDPFYLYVNGLRQNEVAGKEVRVTGINDLYCQVKIEFADTKLGSVTRNRLAVSDGEDNLMDATYKLVRVNNAIKLRFYSMNTVNPKKTVKPAAFSGSPITIQTGSTASGCLTVFSEQGENFFIYLNGVQQNSVAQSRIRIDGLPDLYYQVKLVFADPKIPAYSKNNVSISDGDDQLMDAVYKITRSSAVTRLRFYAMNPVLPVAEIQPGTSVYHWGNQSIPDKPVIVPIPSNAPASVTKQEPVAITQPQPVIKTVPEKDMAAKPEKPAIVSKPVVSDKPAAPKAKPAENKLEVQKSTATKTIAVQEPADWVCASEWPMWKADYANARKNIESAKDDKERLAITEKLLSANCFNTDQVIEMARLFNKEETRFTFVQSAFRHTIDYRNFYRLMNVFQSESIKSKLAAYLQDKRNG